MVGRCPEWVHSRRLHLVREMSVASSIAATMLQRGERLKRAKSTFAHRHSITLSARVRIESGLRSAMQLAAKGPSAFSEQII